MSDARLDQFEDWLIYMDEALEKFQGLFPKELRHRLDFSIASLDFVEDWALQRYTEFSQIEDPKESLILDGLVRYVGETFRKQLGAKWTISLDDPDDADYELPVLFEGKLGDLPVGVHSLVTASIDRREGDYLRGFLEYQLNEAS